MGGGEVKCIMTDQANLACKLQLQDHFQPTTHHSALFTYPIRGTVTMAHMAQSNRHPWLSVTRFLCLNSVLLMSNKVQPKVIFHFSLSPKFEICRYNHLYSDSAISVWGCCNYSSSQIHMKNTNYTQWKCRKITLVYMWIYIRKHNQEHCNSLEIHVCIVNSSVKSWFMTD